MVKRYATKQDFTHEYMMSDDPDGRYVDFVAYDALAARLAEAEGLLRDIYSYAEDQSMETLMDMIDVSIRGADDE